jgi:hypothetical protein
MVHHRQINQRAVGIVGVEILVAMTAGTNRGPLPCANYALERLCGVLGAQTQGHPADFIRRVCWPASVSGSLQVLETRIIPSY